MRTIAILISVFSFAALAAASITWYALESGRLYRLAQDVDLAPSGPRFEAGLTLRYLGSEDLSIPGAAVTLMKFDQEPCERPDLKTQMEIILPSGNPESSSVGVQIEKGCRWEIFVEQKDLFTKSLFAEGE